MKRLIFLLQIIFSVSIFLFSVNGAILNNSNKIPVKFLNIIEGTVFNQNRIPIENVNIELLNDVGSFLARTKTNSSGRFTFSGVSSGRFRVRALPLAIGLLEQTQDVEVIAGMRATSSNTAYIDFYLSPDTQFANSQSGPAEVVFVQDIPQNAKKLFQNGVNNLEKTPDKGLSEIEEAIKIFPSYFDALSRLGREYVLRKEYEKAYPYLIRAIDVNPRSFSSFFRLGYAFYQIKQYPAALEAAKASVILNPTSIDGQLLYGTVLRITGNNVEAEKTLLKINSITKGGNAESHWQLALLYNKLNRNQAAVTELEAFLKLIKDSPEKVKIQGLIAKLKNSGNIPK